GARALARLCQQLESLGQSGTTAGAAELLEPLTAELARAARALHAEFPAPADTSSTPAPATP
ncbi:MAG: hypothetical protein FD161_4279, partial [Limisphaerales bacterium]